MQTYHVRFLTDKEAVDFAAEMMSLHIFAHVSLGFGNTDAVVVAYLPDGTEMPDVLKAVNPTLVEDTSAEEDTDEAL